MLEARIENDFRWGPRINATQKDGVRILAGGGGPLVVEHVACSDFSRGKAFIAEPERFQHLRRGQRRLFGLDGGEITAFRCRRGG